MDKMMVKDVTSPVYEPGVYHNPNVDEGRFNSVMLYWVCVVLSLLVVVGYAYYVSKFPGEPVPASEIVSPTLMPQPTAKG